MLKNLSVAVIACIIAAVSVAQEIPSQNVYTKSGESSEFDHINQITVYSYTYTSATDSTFTQKEVSTFDNQGHKTGNYTCSWDSYNNKYLNYEKEEYVYDANGNNTEYQYWYGEGSEWIQNSLTKNKFDTNNNKIQSIVFSYNPGTENWDTISIQRNEYNAAGMIIAQYDSIKHPYNTPPWEVKRTTHSYDENNNDTTIIISQWFESIHDWGNNYITLNTFDSENRLIETNETDGIHNGNKNTYSYNTEGYLDTAKLFRAYQNGGSITWKLWTRVEYSYTPEHWISKVSIWAYNQQKEALEITRQTLTSYNTNGDKLEVITKLNSQYTGLINSEKTVYEYDDDYNLINEEYFKWDNNAKKWNTSITTKTIYVDGVVRAQQRFSPAYAAGHYYSCDFYYYNNEVKTSAPVRPIDNTELFPNPAHSELTIQNPELKYNLISIISTSGKLVLQKTLSATTTTISVSGINNGVYIAVLQGNTNTKTFKIIKR